MKFSIKKHTEDTTFYTLNGLHDNYDPAGYPLLDEDQKDKAMAKKVKQKLPDHSELVDQYDYYIRTYTDKEPFNPVEKLSIKSKRTNTYIDSVCKSETIFTKVPHSIFKQYIDFLRTKNERILSFIHREIK